jgi:tRNA G37 N-methylase Trm5
VIYVRVEPFFQVGCGIADRISLGLIPSSHVGWRSAAMLLNKLKGGWLHVHTVCSEAELHSQQAECVDVFSTYLRDAVGNEWEVSVKHTEKVKNYAPHLYHYVFDVECRPLNQRE